MMNDVIPTSDERREQSFSRRSIVPLVCLLVAAVICTGCASSRTAEAKRPSVYRGGQYYGDAVHSYDLASQ